MQRGLCARFVLAWLLLQATSLPADEVVQLNGHRFTLPDGFNIEVAAKAPLVDRPITAAFDELGRLYVADSSGSNDKVEKQLADKPHRIVRLEDTNLDGTFDKTIVFADRMMFPEGTMWLDGSLYVAAPPSIWKLTDTNDDGVADERVEWFQGKTLTGCANDLHGPYLGRDGWIYWCKGAFAEQTYERPGKPPLVTRASHIFRARPDGSQIEPVMTGGMDNPVDVVFTPAGERIFSCTFLQQPAGGYRDGLIHALYGGVYGKVHDVIDGHPRTSPSVLPPLTHLGPAAPCGLVHYESGAFGEDYGSTLFTALFNLQQVSRHELIPDGGSFKTVDTEFVVSDNRDFHPTDVLEDADGSLLVVDTGGWYKLCCPTSQLVKPDVLGAIYRVRRQGMSQTEDPRGLQLDWKEPTPAELVRRLAESRYAVRERAMLRLAKAGRAAVGPLRTTLALSEVPSVRRDAVWALTRIDHPEARVAVRSALSDGDEVVRHAALHSISLWRDKEALKQVIAASKTGSLANKRAAAEALGRIGNSSTVDHLFEMLLNLDDQQVNDLALEHSITYALIEIADGEQTALELACSSLKSRRAALVALDQMGSELLRPKIVADELIQENNALRPTAEWILSRHPAWGDLLTPTLARQLSRAQFLSADVRADLAHQLAKLAAAPAMQQLLSDRLIAESASDTERMSVLKAMELSSLKQIPDGWVAGLQTTLASTDAALVRQAAITLNSLPITSEQRATLQPALAIHANDSKQELLTRLFCFANLKSAELTEDQFGFLFGLFDSNNDAYQRSLALRAFSNSRLLPDQVDKLVAELGRRYIGAADAETILQIASTHPSPERAEKIIEGLSNSYYLRGIEPGVVEKHLKPFGTAIVAHALHVVRVGKSEVGPQASALEKRLAKLSAGDVRRGQAVFNSTKANCASCHAIGYLGGKVGPDLTKVGAVRSQRDLLEAVLYPSASFVRSYEPYLVQKTTGEIVSGVLRKNAADEVILVKDAKSELRIPRDQIEQLQPSSVSIMPDGLDRQLSEQELADLLAFLQACK
jgi:putative membrane-bound dehydrogenase-like protein